MDDHIDGGHAGPRAPTGPRPDLEPWAPSWRERAAALVGGTSPWRLAAAVIGAAAAAALGLTLLREPAPLPELTMPVAGGVGDPATATTTSTSVPAAPVVVHAAGAVVSPGVYRLAGGARVADLLAAAGGPLPTADLDRLNLAALLLDGERVFVPLPDEEVPPAEGGTDAAPGAGPAPAATPVDLNRASLADLEALPGVGPATARSILDERERRGRFSSVDDLLDVRGIGEAKLAALRDKVRV